MTFLSHFCAQINISSGTATCFCDNSRVLLDLCVLYIHDVHKVTADNRISIFILHVFCSINLDQLLCKL